MIHPSGKPIARIGQRWTFLRPLGEPNSPAREKFSMEAAIQAAARSSSERRER